MTKNLHCEFTIPYPTTEEKYNLIMDLMDKTYKLGIRCDVDYNVYNDEGEWIYSEILEPEDLYVRAVNDGLVDPFEPKKV